MTEPLTASTPARRERRPARMGERGSSAHFGRDSRVPGGEPGGAGIPADGAHALVPGKRAPGREHDGASILP